MAICATCDKCKVVIVGDAVRLSLGTVTVADFDLPKQRFDEAMRRCFNLELCVGCAKQLSEWLGFDFSVTI